MCGAFLFFVAVPVLLRLFKEFLPFVCGNNIVGCHLLAFLGEWKQPGQGMAKIGYAIIAVIVVSGLFSFG